MCGACPGGGRVSAATAELNKFRLKQRLLSELKHCLAHGCTLTLRGDQWTLRRRTGRQVAYQDIELLISDLSDTSSSDWRGNRSPEQVLSEILSTATRQTEVVQSEILETSDGS